MGTNTGINFLQVSLTELDFKLNKKFKLSGKGIPVDLDLKQKNSYSLDKKTLNVLLTASLFSKTKKRPFTMKVSVEGIFVSNDPKELKKFSKVHAPAHLIPFIRESIGTTTMKANIPPLLLPPFNISTLFKTSKSKKQSG